MALQKTEAERCGVPADRCEAATDRLITPLRLLLGLQVLSAVVSRQRSWELVWQALYLGTTYLEATVTETHSMLAVNIRPGGGSRDSDVTTLRRTNNLSWWVDCRRRKQNWLMTCAVVLSRSTNQLPVSLLTVRLIRRISPSRIVWQGAYRQRTPFYRMHDLMPPYETEWSK